jgi:dihydrodipicolinate synthase/N-acetylneuraminate lyase
MGDWNAAEMLCRPIQALEDLRIAHGAIPVLHTAIKVSGIVDMGRMRPHFGPLNAEIESSVKAAVEPLLELEETFSK